MSKHTPGPWTYIQENETCYIQGMIGGSPGYIGQVVGSNDNVLNNANLVAAAPEMFAALEHAIGHLDAYVKDNPVVSYALIHMKDAVNKAKGG